MQSWTSRRVGLILLSILMASVVPVNPPARAEDGNTQEEKPISRRSPAVALTLALSCTLVPIGLGIAWQDGGQVTSGGQVLIGLGGILGPAAGEFYAGNFGRGMMTSLGRTGALALAVWGYLLSDNCHGGGDCGSGGTVMAVIGSAAWLGLTLWDLIDAPFAAERYNQRMRGPAVAPLVVPPPPQAPAGAPALGLLLSAPF